MKDLSKHSLSAVLLCTFASFAHAEPLQVLYVGGGCCHDYETQKTLIKNGLESRLDCEVTVVHDGGSATDSMIPLYDNVHWHDGFDVVVHHECFAHVTDAEYIDRILAPHRAGLPAVMVHCAVHSYGALQGQSDISKQWRRFLGVHSNGHGAHYPHEVLNVKADHPVMEGFGTGWWNPAGELYRVLQLEENTVPLCTSKDQASGKSQVCVWTNQFDQGRVFGTTLGHHNQTFEDPKFMDLLARGLEWSVGSPVSVEWNRVVAEPERENLARGKSITASSVQPGNEREHATDGTLATRWCASNPSVPQWIQVDLGKPQTLTGVKIEWEFPSQRYRVDVEGSSDGTTFRKLVDKTSDQPLIEFEADQIQHVRVTCSKTSGGWVSIRELKVLGTEIADVDPAETNTKETQLLANVKAAEGFETTLFAGPPAVNYPVFVAADVDGTVYVSQDKNGSLDRKPNRGSVLRLRDLDGDGRADECKRFVDNVDSPRGLVFDRDRLYLMHPPHLSAFIDHDDDGVADEQQILVKNIAFGFDDRPADHTSNGVTLGIDGWLYLAIGDFGFMEAEGTDGTKLQMRGGGVVRVRPDGTGLHVYSHGTRNILEVAVSPRLEAFARDNTNDGGGWDVRLHHFTGGGDHGYPRKYKNFANETIAPLADYGGGSGCGAGWVDEPSWPDAWNDGLYTADWGRGKVFHHPLKPNGVTFSADQHDFISVPRATDIDVDAVGNAYVSSWDGGSFTYKDENVGYVVRVRPNGSGPAPIEISSASNAELVKLLKSDSHRTRLAAQREILARNLSVAETEALTKQALDAAASLASRVAAIYTLALSQGRNLQLPSQLFDQDELLPFALDALGDAVGLQSADISYRLRNSDQPSVQLAMAVGQQRHGLLTDDAATWTRALSHEQAVVRHAARRALSKNSAAALLHSIFVSSDNAFAQWEASRGLAEIHSAEAVELLIKTLEDSRQPDRLRQLTFFALARLVHREGEWTGKSWGTRPDNAGPYYSFARWELSDRIEDALRLAIQSAPADELPDMLAALSANQVQLDDTLRTVIAAAENDPAVWPAAASQLAKTQRLPSEAVPLLIRIAADRSMPAATLASTAEALLSAEGTEALEAALKAMSRLGDELNQPTGRDAYAKLRKARTLERHVDAIITVSASDSPAANWASLALLLLHREQSVSKETRAKVESAYQAAMSTEQGRARLLDGVEVQSRSNDFNPVVVELARFDGPAGNRARSLAAAKGLKTAPPLGGPPIKGMPIPDVIAAVTKPTDHTTAGQVVFSKLTCSKCHSVSPAEQNRGPELSNAARIYNRTQLAEAILNPNKSIAQGFATNAFIMFDGRVIVGFVVKEGDAEVVVRDAEGKEQTLQTDDIDERVVQSQSLMPAGLVEKLSLAEFSALLDYLDSLGT